MNTMLNMNVGPPQLSNKCHLYNCTIIDFVIMNVLNVSTCNTQKTIIYMECKCN